MNSSGNSIQFIIGSILPGTKSPVEAHYDGLFLDKEVVHVSIRCCVKYMYSFFFAISTCADFVNLAAFCSLQEKCQLGVETADCGLFLFTTGRAQRARVSWLFTSESLRRLRGELSATERIILSQESVSVSCIFSRDSLCKFIMSGCILGKQAPGVPGFRWVPGSPILGEDSASYPPPPPSRGEDRGDPCPSLGH